MDGAVEGHMKDASKSASGDIRVLIADDHAVVRQGLRRAWSDAQTLDCNQVARNRFEHNVLKHGTQAHCAGGK